LIARSQVVGSIYERSNASMTVFRRVNRFGIIYKKLQAIHLMLYKR